MTMNKIKPQTKPNHQRLLNRELGILAFNERVLAQAEDSRMPLLERLRYLTIVSSNMDEFFEIRVAELQELSQALGPDAPAAGASLAEISQRAHALIERQYQFLNDSLLPALAQAGVKFHLSSNWNETQRAWAEKIFDDEIEPLLTPIALDPAHPFPRILNKSLNFVVELAGTDAFGRTANIAVVQAPRALPRLMRLPDGMSDAPHGMMLLGSIVQGFVAKLFPGLEIRSVHQFRVTRNSELFVDDEEVTDLREALKGELRQRQYGDEVRLEVSAGCPEAIVKRLLKEFDLEPSDLYLVNGPVNLSRMAQVIDLVDVPSLKFVGFEPGLPLPLESSDLFTAIRKQDLLLHHPYESFEPVMQFLRSAASDPKVVAIKQTVYRTGADSILMEALIAAARAGKEVTVVVELFARFDEETNINWAARLEQAGAHVVYGVVGHKTHAKMALILRREQGRLKRYVHLGTGNYHPRTARLYEDFGLFTADPDLCADVHEVFRRLTGVGKAGPLRALMQSPFTMHTQILASIAREEQAARAGRKAYIAAKMNALLESSVIEALYKASKAGVKIDLIIRGVCALRPGVPGLSENIQVRSIVGRFLEHSRVFHFWAGGKKEVWLSSADWMDRNLHRRVEIAFPVNNPKLKARVLDEAMLEHLADNSNAWIMNGEGHYTRRKSRTSARNSQLRLLEALRAR